jgi:ADP-ribose pyrophosphatase YjhB (NUDIX family)
MTETRGRRVSRATLYEGRIFRIEVDRVELPSGHTVDMEIVRHPGSVVLLPVPSPGEIILVRQYRYTIDRWIWELPAGSLKPGEDPAEAAARECEEEIGLLSLRGAHAPFARLNGTEGRGRGSGAARVHARRSAADARPRRDRGSEDRGGADPLPGSLDPGGPPYCSAAWCDRFADFLACAAREAGSNARSNTSSIVFTR